MVITSPPYWALRDYGVGGQIGLEADFREYINRLCNIFDEVKRVLKTEGTCWVNLGDTYMNNSSYFSKGRQGYEKKEGMIYKENNGIPTKSLCMIPERFAIEMTNRGWILRNQIIWHKSNCMSSSVKDRFTVDFEKVFLFVKGKKYFFEQQLEDFDLNSDVEYRHALRRKNAENYSIKKPYKNNFPKKFNLKGRNKRTVWKIATKAYPEAHFAVYPEKLVETPIKAGCPEKGIVLDPFVGQRCKNN